MPCFSPLQGFRSKIVAANGKRGIVFKASEGYLDLPVKVPCGQCIGCRLERSRQWAMRCLHEASLYEDNCFITLTYNDDNLPLGGGLCLGDFQRFIKRLRKRHAPRKIRFYHCGEYGELLGRPHYHACLFNHDFEDKTPWQYRNENLLYVSASLSELWPQGYSSVGQVTFQSAAYVARYIMKKVTGRGAAEHYEAVDQMTGEISQLPPEYTTMSRRPGIGNDWLKRFSSDVYPEDFVLVNGKKMKPPKYYDLQLELRDPALLHEIKVERKRNGRRREADNTPARLKVKAVIQQYRLDQLKRGLEI